MLEERQGNRGIDYEELREYVDAFRGSSDRARHVLFAVLIVSLLMAVVNYNLMDYSWPINRIKTFLAERQENPDLGEHQVNPGQLDEEIRAVIRDQYLEQFISHAIWVSSPIPGVWIDVNDIGTAGGVVLVLLMLALVYYLAREHENLYLALYKVRSLCVDPDHEKGDSAANFLYHALAMRQALSFPPTRARWRKRWWAEDLGLIFFLPLFVYVWIVWTNGASAQDGGAIGARNMDLKFLIRFQVALAIVICILSLMSSIISRSMALRWRRAFFRVNPGRRIAPQMSSREWLNLRSARRSAADKVRSELVDTVRGPPELVSDMLSVAVSITQSRRSDYIRATTRDRMVAAILPKCEEAARVDCCKLNRKYLRIVAFECPANLWKSGVWDVAAQFRYSYQELQHRP